MPKFPAGFAAIIAVAVLHRDLRRLLHNFELLLIIIDDFILQLCVGHQPVPPIPWCEEGSRGSRALPPFRRRPALIGFSSVVFHCAFLEFLNHVITPSQSGGWGNDLCTLLYSFPQAIDFSFSSTFLKPPLPSPNRPLLQGRQRHCSLISKSRRGSSVATRTCTQLSCRSSPTLFRGWYGNTPPPLPPTQSIIRTAR